MGMGDEIMAAGQARRLHADHGRRVAILDRRGRPRWHPIWQGNPRIARPEEVAGGLTVAKVTNGSSCRPYVDYGRTTKERWFYTDWKAAPGEIWLSGDEYAFAAGQAGLVLIEPHIKPNASPNKRWGFGKCQALVNLLPGLPWAQMGPPGTQWLEGVRRLETPSFRHAAAVVSRARGLVAPEGGLHHAAACFSIPAVVIFGSMTSPANTGYGPERNQVSVYRPHGEGPCGLRVDCPECRAVMDAITPQEIAQHLERTLA